MNNARHPPRDIVENINLFLFFKKKKKKSSGKIKEEELSEGRSLRHQTWRQIQATKQKQLAKHNFKWQDRRVFSNRGALLKLYSIKGVIEILFP